MPKKRKPTGKNQKAALSELQRLLAASGQQIGYKEATKHVAAILAVAPGKEHERAKVAVDSLIRDGHLLLNKGGLCLS